MGGIESINLTHLQVIHKLRTLRAGKISCQMCRTLKLFCMPCARFVDFVSRLFLSERVNLQDIRARVALRLRLYVAIVLSTAGLSCLILTIENGLSVQTAASRRAR